MPTVRETAVVVVSPRVEPDLATRVLNPQLEALGPFCARLGLGIVMLLHGLQKVGFFGGHGFAATVDHFHTALGIPPFLGAVAVLTELVAGALLIIGLFSRFAALAVAIQMVVAMVLVHAKNGFFMNWELKPNVGHGIEMNLALIALALVVLADGAGLASLDAVLARALAGRSKLDRASPASL